MDGHATLIVNPAARRATLLKARLPAIRALLALSGYETQVVETSAEPDSACVLALAAARISSLVLACGGDGTVHGVVQGLARTAVPLGIVPLGTANALARNLRIPLDPVKAVARLLTFTPHVIPLGEIVTATETRYFAVMAGCGPDGALVHALAYQGSSRLKRRFGRQAYYAHAARLFFTRRWPAFQVEYRRPSSNAWKSLPAVAMMASRIPDLGGLFSGLTRQARLTDPYLHVQILRSPAQLAFPAWMLCGRSRLPNPWLTRVDVEELRCIPLDHAPVQAEADAEPLGPLPFTLSLVPAALTLLMAPIGG